jgi:two-component system cell cycle sensor histidine kinase/response regulator CckA
MMKRALLSQHLDALEQRFQALRDQVGDLPEDSEALAPALREVAQALAALRPLQEAEPGLAETPHRGVEASLKEREELYRALTDNGLAGLYLIQNNKFHYVNSAFAQIFGYSPEEIIHLMTPKDLTHPDDLPRHYEYVRQRLAREIEEIHSTIRGVRRDGAIIHVEFLGRRIEYRGRPAIIGTLLDITERRQAEEALKFRAQLLDVVQDSIIAHDLEGAIIYANEAAAQARGYTKEELLGKSIWDLIAPGERQHSLQRLCDLQAGKVLEPFESTHISKGGTEFPVEVHGHLSQRNGKKIFLGVARDITDRKRAEEAQRESEERYRTLFETAPYCMCMMDLQLNIIMRNQAGIRLFELKEKGGQPRNYLDFVAPEDRERTISAFVGLIETGQVRTLEVNLLKRDGTRLPCLISASLIQDASGRPQAIIGVAQDVSDLRRAEDALANHLQFMRVLLDTIPNPIFYKDAQGAYLSCNKAFGELLGITPEEIFGKTVYDLHPKELADKYHQMDLVVLQNAAGQVYEVPLQAADGTRHHVMIHKATFANAEGNVMGLVGTIVDISDLKRAEEAIRESEARLRAIFEHAPVGITMVDPSGRFLQTNPAFQAILGYSATELQNLTFQQLTHPEDLPGNLQLQEELLAGQRQYYSLEKRYLRKDGEIVWVYLMLSRLTNARGEVRVVGTVLDITAQKRAEAALRESEQRFRLMAETIQDAFWISSPKLATKVYVSPGYQTIFGRNCEELYQSPQSFLEAVHPDDRELVQSQIMLNESQGLPFSQEFRIIRPDGSVGWIHNRGFPVKDDQGRVILYTGVARDITERRTLEQQLLLAQKMEAVGRLAGGVAHDFNNLLMAIASYGEIMREKIPKDDLLYSYLEDILKATDRATALTGQLLTFSRKYIARPRVIDLNQVILDLKRMLQRLITEDIELKIITAPSLGKVKADPGYLNQIIMNLVINARDALVCGGQIIVETSEVNFDTSRPTRFGVAPPGPYVALEVSDSGIGINEEVQTHIFEPFFTTKEPGKGTGLGLSIVYGVIKQSGGFIDLESEPGLGSTFTIYLPRLEAEVEPTETKAPKRKKFRGEETILMVEDEDVLRTLLAKFLRLHGYAVLEARHGDEALQICAQHQGPIHLMVTDVVMPKMSGRVLADRISSSRPEMKVLFMSGYTEDEVVQRGVADLSVAFLQKPFKPIDLARQIQVVLHPQRP